MVDRLGEIGVLAKGEDLHFSWENVQGHVPSPMCFHILEPYQIEHEIVNKLQTLPATTKAKHPATWNHKITVYNSPEYDQAVKDQGTFLLNRRFVEIHNLDHSAWQSVPTSNGVDERNTATVENMLLHHNLFHGDEEGSDFEFSKLHYDANLNIAYLQYEAEHHSVIMRHQHEILDHLKLWLHPWQRR